MRNFLILSAIVIAFVSYAANEKNNNAIADYVYNDTLPKYQKVYVIVVPQNELQPVIDSMNTVMSNLGRAMSVDQSDQWKQFYNRQLSRLLSNVKVDSIKLIPNPQINKNH